MLLSSYKEFEERVGIFRERPGSKRENIIKAINNFHGNFSISDIENACPNISRDMIRKVLREEGDKGHIAAIGIGRLAKWHKKK